MAGRPPAPSEIQAPDFDGDTDELESIRARMRSEILAARSAPVAPPAPPAHPTDLTATTFDRFLADNERVVIDVWAPWCGPCRAFSPILDALAVSLAPTVRFGKVNSDAEPGIAGRFGVTGIPTVLSFRRSKLVDRFSGAHPKDVVETRLRRFLELPGR